MIIEEIQDDLFNTTAPIIIHGCNCQGVMGSGVALAVKQKYPEAYKEYKRVEKDQGLMLGTINYKQTNLDFCKGAKSRITPSKKCIVNALTQQTYGRDKNLQYASYEAIRSCMKEINTQFRKEHIAMPKIGCGLGNLEWGKVKTIIEEELVDIERVSVYYL